jgi:probable phosphoglycerate mutase
MKFCVVESTHRLVYEGLRMKSAHICIARHGETDWNKSGILQGWFDIPINELGRKQATLLAASLTNANFDAVWSSPLARARETAEIVAAALQLPPPTYHEGLKEKHFGAIQGIPKSELAELDPALLEQILRRNPAAEFVGGEGLDEFVDRVLAAFDDIGARHAGERILVVTHGWVMDVVARHVKGHSRSAVLHLKPQNGECLWVEVARQQLQASSAACV